MSAASDNSWSDDVGILAMEVYVPSTFVDQAQLEVYDGVSKGKYTIGLGQAAMGFCGDREDTNSLCFTVVKHLMEKNCIDARDIGRLEVGTESILDKSKSVKTVLMQLFESSGNTSIEGVDCINACYGSTQAFFNAIDWMEGSAWDGRQAIVVCADIAVYAAGNARPSGGAGAVAMLIGPHAPLVVERGLRSVHMCHAYDFYKPNMNSEYPVVDSKLSIRCFLEAVQKTYHGYLAKGELKKQKLAEHDSEHKKFATSLDDIDFIVFHSPVCKLTQKAFAHLTFLDFLRSPLKNTLLSPGEKYHGFEKFRSMTLDELCHDDTKAKTVEKASLIFSSETFEKKTRPSLLFANNVGNAYTASVYAGLASLLVSVPTDQLVERRIGLFCYGSGFASAFFSIKVCADPAKLSQLVDNISDMTSRLRARKRVEPQQFVETLELREQTHQLSNYTPRGSVEDLWPGTYFLEHVDEKFRRVYSRKTSSVHPRKTTEAVGDDLTGLQINTEET